MDVLHAPEDLIDEELNMVVAETLSFDNLVEVGAHQRGHEVDIGEAVHRFGRGEDVQQPNDVLVIHVLEHPQLSVRPFGVDGGLERPGQLLDGHLGEGTIPLTVGRVIGTANLIKK